MSAPDAELTLSPEIKAKLEWLQTRMGAQDLASTLDKSLEITNYILDTVSDPNRKLLVEQAGKFTELTKVA